ncbi:uncharacterized protein LOC131691766 [Topomyia yanbarensis]|uniref:uncharacterized protein LOC131691766 n=1 Tax=Topomyia yanbarensis TaxID=2498891 RepID=UPI00273CD64E|nr:uncharacterized protein LOC131691766 [Topomyia yanbarensis]
MTIAVNMINRTMATISILLIYCVLLSTALSCDSCGKECTSACGTRHFRTCCFNYLRKRSSSPPLATAPSPPPPPPSQQLSPHKLNLEMWLEKNRIDQADRRSHHHRPLDDLQGLLLQRMLLTDTSDGENDYETTKDDTLASRDVVKGKRNPLVTSNRSNRNGDYRHPLLEGDPEGRESDQRTSEESEPSAARLQLLYDA